jgi:hypothetical protein
MKFEDLVLQFVFDARMDLDRVKNSLELIEKEIAKEKARELKKVQLQKKCRRCGALLSVVQVNRNQPFCSRDCYKEWILINK